MKKFLLALAGVALAVSSSFAGVNQLYGIGGIEGWGNWNPAQGYQFTKVSDGVFTWSGSISGTAYFAFASEIGSWDVINSHRFSPDTKDKAIVVGDNAMVANKDTSWKIGPGEYTFTINTNTMTLTVKEDAEIEKVITYDVWGPFASEEWGSTPMTATVGNDNEWTALITPVSSGVEFGVRQLTNGAQSDWYALGYSFDGYNGNSAVLDGSIEGNCVFDLPADGNEYKFTFVPSTKQLTITRNAGVADITVDKNAAVEYFNLQGVRVSNPVSGNLYIVRQGDKVTKTVVR